MNSILPKHVLGPGHVVLVLLSLVLLEWGRTLLLPLGMALVLLLTFLPVRNLWKEKIGLPGSGIVAFLACLAVLAGFCGLLWFIYHYHQAELAQLPRDLSSSLKSTGTSVKEVTDRLLSQATALEAILPALAFFFFGLVEYDLLRKRLLAALPSRQGEALLERVEHTSSLVGIYWLARTAAGLVTGLAVGLGCGAWPCVLRLWPRVHRHLRSGRPSATHKLEQSSGSVTAGLLAQRDHPAIGAHAQPRRQGVGDLLHFALGVKDREVVSRIAFHAEQRQSRGVGHPGPASHRRHLCRRPGAPVVAGHFAHVPPDAHGRAGAKDSQHVEKTLGAAQAVASSHCSPGACSPV